MRSKLAKATRNTFDRLLTTKWPFFDPVTVQRLTRGDRLYRWTHGKDLHFFISLEFPPQRDCFQVGLGWTIQAEFPDFFDIFHPVDIPISEVVVDKVARKDTYFQLADFLSNRNDFVWGWEIARPPTWEEVEQWLDSEDPNNSSPDIPLEEAIKNVTPCVEDAIQKIEEYAIPYFHRVIKELTEEKK